ncbi:hypothetical protein [Vibrio navarrensis]|uniref:hypothetical protein n=1 Tax=Vibrio navarrensis TaxID=29495 RepID=UPI0015596623|nr:hypothetical protein [Vibrio navarrensis]
MSMLKNLIIASFYLLLSQHAYASCVLPEGRSVMLEDEMYEACQSIDEHESDAVILHLDDQQTTQQKDYWDEWALKSEDSPVISQNLASNHFGIGFWLPEEYQKEAQSMTTEEWLRSHGVLFSIGFGDKKAGHPRMRFDYRWHDTSEGDVMMQIELPF